MCGILAALGLQGTPESNRRLALKQSALQRHRGPDATGVYQSPNGAVVLCHERLSIIDPTDAGRQPMCINCPEGGLVWMVNSEIYNHEKLRQTVLADVDLSWTSCDSAVVGYLYQKFGPSCKVADALDGIFAGVVYDEANDHFLAFRDPIGVNPLYWGKDADGTMWLSSEMKGLHGVCKHFDVFPPGCVYSSKTGAIERYYSRPWMDVSIIPTEKVDHSKFKSLLINAVVKRMMTDVPFALYLSGGLDSSLVAAIASRHLQEAKNTYDTHVRLHTFSIGIKGSPDLLAARKVAAHLGTVHHECYMTVEQGIDALRDLVYHMESYQQVRAALPNYLLARRVKAAGFKVALSGEGADEAMAGYMFFRKAPSAGELHQESVRLVKRLHFLDIIRANRSSCAFGVEVRVPFLDLDFLNYVMSIDPHDKMYDEDMRPDGVHPKREKYILRKAFDDPNNPYLPPSILFRPKERFSDGVGCEWGDGLKAYADTMVTDEAFANRTARFPDHVPLNKEQYFLQSLFTEIYPKASSRKTIHKGLTSLSSTPNALHWDASWTILYKHTTSSVEKSCTSAAEGENENGALPDQSAFV